MFIVYIMFWDKSNVNFSCIFVLVDIHALPNISIISIIYDVDGLSCQNWKIIINDPSIAPLGRDGRVMS